MNHVQNYSILMAMDQSRFQQGEIIHCIDEDKIYYFNEGSWTPVTAAADSTGLSMSIYELNKSIIAQLDPIVDFTTKIEEINEWRKDTKNNFYLMYGKEISYFTLFNSLTEKTCYSLGEEVIDCLVNIGNVYDIYLNEDYVWEIWCDEDGDGDVTCLYLFPYDIGVVEFI